MCTSSKIRNVRSTRTLVETAMAVAGLLVGFATMPVKSHQAFSPRGPTSSFMVLLIIWLVSAASSLSAGPTPRVLDIARRLDPELDDVAARGASFGNDLVFDFNRDGHLDLLLVQHRAPWRLLLSNGKGRYLSHLQINPPHGGDLHSCVAADFGSTSGPRDGLTDLYCVRGAERGTSETSSNFLLFQTPEGRLSENQAGVWGVADPAGRGRSVAVFDMQNDGLPDLYVGNWQSRFYSSLDRLFLHGGKTFVELTTANLPSDQGSLCAQVADFDGDGYQDIFACSYSPRLYRNRAGKTYRNVSSKEGLPAVTMRDAQFADMNADTRPDLILVNPIALEIYLNRGATPHFSEVSYRLVSTHCAALCTGDAEGDGDLDILLVRGRNAISIVQNRDLLLLNDGSGNAFRILGVPQPPVTDSATGARGEGDRCSAIPNYQGNRAAFTITNGRGQDHDPRQEGYRQFIVYR